MKGVLTCPPGVNASAIAAAGCQPYDETGAMVYTVVILSMFALGIVLLIGAQVSKNPHDSKISQYMKQMELVRENIKYRQLLQRRTRAASVAIAAAAAATAVPNGFFCSAVREPTLATAVGDADDVVVVEAAVGCGGFGCTASKRRRKGPPPAEAVAMRRNSSASSSPLPPPPPSEASGDSVE